MPASAAARGPSPAGWKRPAEAKGQGTGTGREGLSVKARAGGGRIKGQDKSTGREGQRVKAKALGGRDESLGCSSPSGGGRPGQGQGRPGQHGVFGGALRPARLRHRVNVVEVVQSDRVVLVRHHLLPEHLWEGGGSGRSRMIGVEEMAMEVDQTAAAPSI